MSKPNEEDLKRLEALLTTLMPRASSVDRDRLLFRAGQASVRRWWTWPLATFGSAATALCLAVALFLRPAPVPIVHTIRVEVPVPVPTAERRLEESQTATAPIYTPEPLSPTLSHWRLQQQALRFGAESLPDTSSSANEPPGRVGVGLSAGSRPSFVNQSLLFPLGEP